jgi:hypothetical protein
MGGRLVLVLRTHKTRCTALVRTGALGLVFIALLAGCSSLKKTIDKINRSASASAGLESFIHDELTTKFHRSVRSVSCTPYVDEVVNSSSAHVTCVVRFTDGSSYTTPGTITNTSQDPSVGDYNYSFNDPPGLDITTAPLPQPAVTLPATSPESLFTAHNLVPVVKQLTRRFGSQNLILQLAIHPGELEAVIGSNGKAWPVSVTHSGALRVGPAASFDGSRSGIGFAQLDPGVIQRLTKLIVAKGGVPLAHVDRFVLTSNLPRGNSGWNIYLTSGSTRFQSLVLGDQLVMITPTGPRALSK